MSCFPLSVHYPLPGIFMAVPQPPLKAMLLPETYPELFIAISRSPLLRLRTARYHTVAQERRCASQQKLRADVAA
jgi:hypothetical protein